MSEFNSVIRCVNCTAIIGHSKKFTNGKIKEYYDFGWREGKPRCFNCGHLVNEPLPEGKKSGFKEHTDGSLSLIVKDKPLVGKPMVSFSDEVRASNEAMAFFKENFKPEMNQLLNMPRPIIGPLSLTELLDKYGFKPWTRYKSITVSKGFTPDLQLHVEYGIETLTIMMVTLIDKPGLRYHEQRIILPICTVESLEHLILALNKD